MRQQKIEESDCDSDGDRYGDTYSDSNREDYDINRECRQDPSDVRCHGVSRQSEMHDLCRTETTRDGDLRLLGAELNV